MNQHFTHKLLAAAIALASTSSAWALAPREVRINDVVVVTPTLQVTGAYDDNIRSAAANEESSFVTTISPKLEFKGEGRKSGYKVTYEAVSDIFHSQMEDNNTDHLLTVESAFALDARNRLGFDLNYSDIESTDEDSTTRINDHYTQQGVAASYSYGAQSARMNLDTGIEYQQLRYTDGKTVNETKERDTVTADSTFYYRVAPKTRLLAQATWSDFDYVTADDVNGNSLTGVLGATWDATAKTSGTVKIGKQRRSYDDSRYDSQSASNWSAKIDWRPRTYSRFSLATSNFISEGDDGSIANEASNYSLDWSHDWSALLSSNIGYSLSNLDYIGTSREDDLYTTNIGVTYRLLRWVDLQLGYRHIENDSDLASEDFKRNIYMLSINASL